MGQEILRNGLKPSVVKGLSSRGGGHLSTPANSFGELCGLEKRGFTLAEMMVVMLILSIVMAAMAPVMTTRNKSDYSSPWRYSPSNSSDAYFGVGDSQVALLGQADVGDAERDTKLLIRTAAGSGFSHLLFKTGDTIVGRLYLDESNLYLSNTSSGGSESTSVGVDALSNNTGENNTAIGNYALHSNTSGIMNTGIGSFALRSTSTGENNTGVGFSTLADNTTGSGNVAMGTYALQNNTTGNDNIAIGRNAFQQAEMSGSNTIIGTSAMSHYSGNNNTALGTQAMFYGSGNNNTAIGTNANYPGGSSERVYNNTTAVGYGAQSAGDYSVAIGSDTTATTESVTIGAQAGSSAKGISIGYYATASKPSSGGVGGDDGEGSPIAIGYNASTSAYNTIAVGNQAKASNTGSIAIGSFSNGYLADSSVRLNSGAVASGSNSLALGSGALAEGSNSVAISANSHTTDSSAIAIGSQSLADFNSIAIGMGANAGGARSVAIGTNAGGDSSTGENIAIGFNACHYVTGSNKTCIGVNSGPSAGDVNASNSDNVVYIGNTNSTVYIPGNLVVGKRAFIGASLGNSGTKRNSLFYNTERGWHGLYGYSGDGDRDSWGVEIERLQNSPYWSDFSLGFTLTNFVTSSDRRLKYVGSENTSGLDKIRQLKVFNYTFKKDEKKTPHVGVIAQDLQKIFPDAVKKGVDGFLTIRMEDMFYAVINAIKELDSRVTALEKENQELKARIERLESKIK